MKTCLQLKDWTEKSSELSGSKVPPPPSWAHIYVLSDLARNKADPDFLECVCDPKDSLCILNWKTFLCKVLFTHIKGKYLGTTALKRNLTSLICGMVKRKGFPVR